MGVGEALINIVDRFDAPSYLYWSVLPFFVFAIIGYIIGFAYFKEDFEAGGYNLYQNSVTCNQNANEFCTGLFKDKMVTTEDYDRCVDDYMNNSNEYPECESVVTGKTSKWVVLAVYIIAPLVVSSILTSMLYHTVLYIKNPRLAATSVIWGIFKPSGSSAGHTTHHHGSARATSYVKPGYFKYRR